MDHRITPDNHGNSFCKEIRIIEIIVILSKNWKLYTSIYMYMGLRLRRGIDDNSKLFFFSFLKENITLIPDKNHLNSTFYGNIILIAHSYIKLVSCFGINGPLRQYFNLYLTLPLLLPRHTHTYKSSRRNYDSREKKYPNNSHPHLLQA